MTPKQIIDALEAARPEEESALVFDADGTLWEGDVGEDVYLYAVHNGLLREEARQALHEVTQAHDLMINGSAAEMAGELLLAHARGRLPERVLYEVMTWCYAGYRPDELVELSRQVFEARNLAGRLQRDLVGPIVDWAREHGHRTLIVSASPLAIVRAAAEHWGFASDEVRGARPLVVGGRIAPRMDEPLPFGEAKCGIGRALVGEGDWLASFGDSPFDLAMLREARVGVAVRPKPELLAEIAGSGVLVLD